MVIKIKPSLVLGTGGAVSGPVLLAGFLLRKKTVIFEPNVVPGLTNRWLSRFVDMVIVVFDSTKAFFKTKSKYNFLFPVRSEISRITLKDQLDSFNKSLRVLVLGGSQGSFVINQVVSKVITSDTGFSLFIKQEKKNLNI